MDENFSCSQENDGKEFKQHSYFSLAVLEEFGARKFCECRVATVRSEEQVSLILHRIVCTLKY